MFSGDWLQRREMLSLTQVALIDALHDNLPITYREWNRRTNQLANFLRGGLGIPCIRSQMERSGPGQHSAETWHALDPNRLEELAV